MSVDSWLQDSHWLNNADPFTIYVCVDCYYHHYYKELPDGSEPTNKPWNLWEPGYEHKYAISDSGDRESHFSHWPCDACGTHLAGDRYEMTGWLPKEQTGDKETTNQ